MIIVKMEGIPETTPMSHNKENAAFSHAGQKMVKYGSFDSATKVKRLRISKSCHSWQTYGSYLNAGNAGFFISSPGSSNTLTGTMYTASEGVRTSVSGMTSFSDSVFDGEYLTPIGGSRASLNETKNVDYYDSNSDSGSSDGHDFQKENALNEERLKDIKLQRESSKSSIKRKLIKGINGKSKRKGRLKDSKECVNDNNKDEVKNNVYNVAPVTGILKKSVSNDSADRPQTKLEARQKRDPVPRRDKAESEPLIGGTKALLVKKVSRQISFRRRCTLSFVIIYMRVI